MIIIYNFSHCERRVRLRLKILHDSGEEEHTIVVFSRCTASSVPVKLRDRHDIN